MKTSGNSWQRFSGWGRTAPTVAQQKRVADAYDIADRIRSGGPLLVRGLGRSYGDAAQCAGGTLADMSGLASVQWHDGGLVTVGAGLSLRDLINATTPRGWFVPVTPGTSWVTVGGAIAADVHGKNHHRDGSFGMHVTRMGVVDGSGTYCDLRPDDQRFWATVGGMGLTGAIVDATLRLLPVETSQMLVSTRRTRDLDDTIEHLHHADAARYSVAWLDCLAKGSAIGRGIVTFGDHARANDVWTRDEQRTEPILSTPRIAAPRWLPSTSLNKHTIGLFNSVWYQRAPRVRDDELQSIKKFFHPLDAVAGWNHIYGRRGFIQYQFVVPDSAYEELRSLFLTLVEAEVPSFLTVLKRFGAGNSGFLSFPIAGWTLAVDIPTDAPSLAQLLDGLDERVVAAGGRVYLAKDSRMAAAMLPRMYPNLERWLSVRDEMDPHGVFASDLGRRLRLVPAARS